MGFKNVSTIIEGRLFLGNLVAAASTRSQTERRITHILSVCLESIPAQDPHSGIVHMRIPVEDHNHADLLIWLPHACRFIDDALRSGGIVLVHGVHGLSRGAAVMAAYLMWSRRISPTEALDIVRRQREQIWPNAGFQEQLALFEMCRYQPSLNEGIYVRWHQNLERQIAGRSVGR
ncbi:phosphatases II [Vararia minispora EC-137]|uniref:Phosphatases II n=1 Tax=Vararia minispora EC-137 TaxID=1314806 RepID=A0ACB8QJ69_9AGAM|nr:phosphatases II [Vararia minispora EC-137]